MEKKRGETIWTSLDRKATAIAEFTMRQYRTDCRHGLSLGWIPRHFCRTPLLHRCDEYRD